MYSITSICLFPVLLGLLHWIVKYFILRRLRYRDGCAMPPLFPHHDFLLGTDYWLHMRRAARESRWLKETLSMFEKYGPTYEVCDLGRRLIHTCDARNIQSVWAGDAKSWGLQPLRDGLCAPFFDRSLATVDGELWTQSHNLVAPTFARAEIANLSFLKTHTDLFLEQIPKDGSMVDLQPLLKHLLLDVSSAFLFGEPMGSLLPELEQQSSNFIINFEKCWSGVGDRVRLGPLRLLHHDRQWLESVEYVHSRLDVFIDRAIERNCSREAGKEESPRHILLDEIVKQISDKALIRSEILGVFGPARESIAGSLTNVLHVLARKPLVYARLRQEIETIGDGEVTFESIKSLDYLHWVLYESMRMYPTTAQSYRQALRDTRLPTGGGPDGQSPIYIQKGDVVMASMWGMHQRRETWGNDVGEFRPERWRDLKPGPTFAPFLLGPRACPARQMVLIQEAYILVRFVQTFKAVEQAEPNPWMELRGLDFRSKHGAKVKLTPA